MFLWTALTDTLMSLYGNIITTLQTFLKITEVIAKISDNF